jgi:hypothetical protein
MIGRIFKKLSYCVRKEEDEWRSNNAVRRELSYSRLRGILVDIAEHPLGCPLAGLVILSAGSAGLYFAPSSWLPKVPTDFKTADLITYFWALWSVQAAVAALVYPIVIAFVTLLLQRGHGAKSLLHIYLHDSTAIFSGLNSFFLLVLMALQYLFLTVIRAETGIAWLLVDGAWFLVNLALASFFLYRTFEFVRPSRRAETIRLYAINVTWPRELEEHLSAHRFQVAVEEKLLPGSSYAAEAEEKQASVWLGPSGLGTGAPMVERFLPRDSMLIDVRFRFLAWATALWIRRTKREWPNKNKDHHSETPVLLYPVCPGFTYSGNTALCRVIGPVSVSRLGSLLVRWSFKFRQTSPQVELAASDILDDLKAEATVAISGGEPQAFSDAVDEMVDLYVLLIEASAFKDNQGRLDNYARVSDQQHGFGRAVYKTWSRRFMDLFDASAERVGSDEAFFVDLIYIPGRLFSQLDEIAHADILTHFVELPPILFHRLATWWVKTLEQQGVMVHDACNPSSLRPPFFGTYDSLLRQFVGAWESLKNDRFPPRRDEACDWSDLQAAGRYLEGHLHATAAMVIDCVHRGDKTGAEWVLDVLLKWFPELRFRFDAHSYFIRRGKLLCFEITGLPWAETKGALDVEEDRYIQDSAPKALFSVILRNYWTDVCCIVAYMIAIRGKLCSVDQSLPALFVEAIVSSETPRAGGHAVGRDRPIGSANDLFMAIIRQYYSRGGYRRGYRSRLDHLVERLAESTKEKMVPGRIYSGWGADDLASIIDGQLFLLTLLVPEHWSPMAEIEGTTREWLREDDEKLREMVRDLKQWKERVLHRDFAEYRRLFECVKGNRGGQSFENATTSLAAGFEEVVTKVEAIRREAIRELPISETRLREVGKWASALGFTKDSGAFPLPLFGVVNTSESEFESRSLVIKDIEKGEYTEPEMAQRAINEEEQFGRVIRDRVASSVLAKTIKRLEPIDKDGSSPDVYWEQMKRYSKEASEAGRHAILLIENPTIPDWIYRWTDPYLRRPEEIPPDLEAWRDPEIQSDSYLGSLNKITVYSAPIQPGASILLTLESFRSLTFKRLPNGNFVLVEALSGANPALIDLKLTWYFTAEIEIYPAVRLTYGGRGLRRRRKVISQRQ